MLGFKLVDGLFGIAENQFRPQFIHALHLGCSLQACGRNPFGGRTGLLGGVVDAEKLGSSWYEAWLRAGGDHTACAKEHREPLHGWHATENPS